MLITHDLALGGLQQVVFNICRTIDRSRFNVSVLCLNERGAFAQDIEALDIPVYLLPQKESGVNYTAFLDIAKVLRKHQIEIIHTHNTQPFVEGTIAGLLANVKTMIHTDHARIFPDKFRYMFAEWVVSHFHYRVVGCSEHTTNNLRHYEKISRKKLITIDNGIDESRFDVQVDAAILKKSLGIKKSGLIVGLASRLSAEKGVDSLVKAMPQILASFADATLLVAGEGDELENLEEQTRELGLENDIVFCGVRKDIPQLLQIIDVYVLPSYSEGLPMALLEAMASRKAIVATNVGGMPNAITNGECGEIVPPHDPSTLADAIVSLLHDQDRRIEYGRAARERFEALYSARIMTEKYQLLYEKHANLIR